MPGKRVRLVDVAAAAGVSRATASRVLAGTPRNVSPELAQKVSQAAQDLGYRVNAAAKTLRTGQTGLFGIVVPTLSNPYFVALTESLAAAARQHGRDLLIADSQNSTLLESKHLDRLAAGRVDGICVIPVSYHLSTNAVIKANDQVPIVQLDRFTKAARIASTALDNRGGMRTLIQHLHETGRSKPAYLGAEPTSSAGYERGQAFEMLCPKGIIVSAADFSMAAGRKAAKHLLMQARNFDSVICGADVLAVALHSACRRERIQIPSDIAIASFDGSDLLELMDPPITSLQTPLQEMADEAISQLKTIAESERLSTKRPYSEEIATIRLEGKLVARESTWD